VIVERDGWWWPEGDWICRKSVMEHGADDVAWVLANVPGRDLIVQAGGNVGCYPLALAPAFQQVLTFEPDPINFTCLFKNAQARDALDRVEHHHAALGGKPGLCAIRKAPDANCGAHRVEDGRDVPVLTIDGLLLTACDAIWLDVEGSELAALQGATATIERFAPTIITEEKGHFGLGPNEIADFLAVMGYRLTSRRLNDRLYTKDPQ
jgi:FkbM family methyltransferase